MFNDPVALLEKYFPKKSLVFLDIETSGLHPPTAVILSIAMKSFHQAESEPVEEEPSDLFDTVILPTDEEWEAASPDALKINGITKEYLDEEGIPLFDSTLQLGAWLMKHHVGDGNTVLVGQNPKFDLKFLRHYMLDTLKYVGFPFPEVIDIMSLFKSIQVVDPTLKSKSYKGHDISEALGVEPEDSVHTAVGGVEAVYRNYWGSKKHLLSVINKLRDQAVAGGSDRVMLIPSNATTKDGWKTDAGRLGWTSIENGNLWVDKEDTRWRYYFGPPQFLIKI